MRTLLLVEDDDLKAKEILRIVTLAGIPAERASTMVEAARLLRREGEGQIGAVITDWQFPFNIGTNVPVDHAGEVVVRMAQDRQVPYIVISGRDPVEGVKPWLEVGNTNDLKAWLAQQLP